jgi:drug/metabolite transporter (DMT)-like permease
MSDERRAMLLMLVFVASWALVEALAAHLMKQYSRYQVVWTRYAVHLAFMLAVWGWREPAPLWRTRRPVYQLGRSLLMLGMPVFWIAGMQLDVGAGALIAVFWLAPLMIVALARIFLAETVDAWSWLSCGVAILGAVLMHAMGHMPRASTLVFPFAAALCFAGYVVMTRPLRHESTRANLFYTAFGVFIALSPAMPFVWVTPNAHDLAILTSIGLVGLVGLYALDRMAAAAPVSVTAPMAAMQLAFTALPSIVLHHMVPDRLEWVGLVLIGAVAVFTWARARGRVGPLVLEKSV